MIINIIGDCDKRPVLYTVMKILQTLGDVLLISSSSRLLRLSDTRESGGHYQNTMVCVTNEGVDDFLDTFGYSMDNFEHVIVDNIVAAEADVCIYVEGLEISEQEKDFLEYIENIHTIKLYKGKLLTGETIYRLEQFEALADMCPINKQIAIEVSKVLAPQLKTTTENLVKIALTNLTASVQKKPEKKGPVSKSSISLGGRFKK